MFLGTIDIAGVVGTRITTSGDLVLTAGPYAELRDNNTYTCYLDSETDGEVPVVIYQVTLDGDGKPPGYFGTMFPSWQLGIAFMFLLCRLHYSIFVFIQFYSLNLTSCDKLFNSFLELLVGLVLDWSVEFDIIKYIWSTLCCMCVYTHIMEDEIVSVLHH